MKKKNPRKWKYTQKQVQLSGTRRAGFHFIGQYVQIDKSKWVLESKDTKILTKAQRLPSDANHPPQLPAGAGEEQLGREPAHPPRKRITRTLGSARCGGRRSERVKSLTGAEQQCPSPVRCSRRWARRRRTWCSLAPDWQTPARPLWGWRAGDVEVRGQRRSRIFDFEEEETGCNKEWQIIEGDIKRTVHWSYHIQFTSPHHQLRDITEK